MTSTDAAARPLDLSRVLGASGRVLRKEFLSLTALGVVIYGVPSVAIEWMQYEAMRGGDTFAFLWGWIPLMLLSSLFTGAAVKTSLAAEAGERTSAMDGLMAALRAILPLMVATVLMLLGVFAGLFLLVVPGLMISCRWAVAIPVVVAERTGPMQAMGRSAQLTKGNRWAIFGLYVIYGIAAFIVGSVASVATRGSAAFSNDIDDVTLPYIIASGVTGTLLAVVLAVVTAMTYLELRRGRGQAESLDEVFA